MSGCQKSMRNVWLDLLQSQKKHGIQQLIQANTEDRREKIQALSLAKQCYSMKLELLTNAAVVDDAIRFVSSQKSEEKRESSCSNSNEDEKEESCEADYDEDEELEETKEEETVEITSITTNQIF
jgi:hypothetical protein